VRVDVLLASLLADGSHPPIRGAAVETLPVMADQDRADAAFADRHVDSPCGARHERYAGGLVALADNLQRALAALKAEVLDTRSACFADPQPVEAKQHGECGVLPGEVGGSDH
jgi:hypothetical protein